MGLLTGKNALIFGVANERSIAWGITQAFQAQGARIGLSYAGEVLEKRVRTLAKTIDCNFVEPCDVTKDEEIQTWLKRLPQNLGRWISWCTRLVSPTGRSLLGLITAPAGRAFIPRWISACIHSLPWRKAFQPYLVPGSALLTLTYYGSEKVAPGYNVMGVAKAALEASVRYLAYDLGPQGCG